LPLPLAPAADRLLLRAPAEYKCTCSGGYSASQCVTAVNCPAKSALVSGMAKKVSELISHRFRYPTPSACAKWLT